MLLLTSCHESLPPRLDPTNIFGGSVEARYVLRGPPGPQENNVEICIRITNNYDETLQAKAILSGALAITIKKDTSHRRTIALDASNLISANYDHNTQVLAVDPGAFIHLKCVWDFLDDRQQDLRSTLFAMYPDPSCSLRHISVPVTIVVSGFLKIFDRTDLVAFGPAEFTFTYADVPIRGTDCPLVTDDTPCGSTN